MHHSVSYEAISYEAIDDLIFLRLEPALRFRSVASLVSAQVIRGVVMMQQGFSTSQNEASTHMPLST